VNHKNLNTYKVVFDDGSSKSVYGFWESHAWFIAEQLFPSKTIQNLELESSHIETRETQAPAA
jgi:hypothetical protein